MTLFEALTIAAIRFFNDAKVKIGVFETGLGGRLDATNIFKSKYQILTPISLDHQEFLGRTLTHIAKEKAAIIKKNGLVFTSNQGKILTTISLLAKKQHAKLFTLRDSRIKNCQVKLEGTTFDFEALGLSLKNLKTNLIGRHQAENAALALLAFKKIIGDPKLKITKINEKTIRKSLASIPWRGRFEILQKSPLLIIDGAHNPAKIEALVQTLRDLNLRKNLIFFAAKENKEVAKEFPCLCSVTKKLYLVKTNLPQMTDVYKLKKIAALSLRKVEISSFREMRNIINQRKRETVIITGSLYLIGEYLKKIKNSN